MKCLLIHQSMPGQYVHIARHLAQSGPEVSFITQPRAAQIAGVRKLEYKAAAPSDYGHAHTRELESGVTNGLAVARLCEWLARDGFVPDIVVGHNGWGELLYVKDLWPQTPLLGYFEFFYRANGSDVDFDHEFPPEPDAPMRLRTRNALNLLGPDAVDWGQSPTEWQRSQYPKPYRDPSTVVRECIAPILTR